MDGHQSKWLRIEPDRWLASIFGYEVFKVSLRAQGEDEMRDLSAASLFADDRPAFYYAKVPANRVSQVRDLTRLGFNVIDVNVTFERKPARLTNLLTRPSIMVRDILPDEHEDVLGIAASCFVYSRFHLDPQLPNRLANDVKRAWVDSYFHRHRGERFLVAELAGRPVGFLAVLSTTLNGQRVRVIDLMGVEKAYQGHGVGRSLVDFFIDDSAEQADSLKAGTQVANIPSMCLYEQCGFCVADTAYVLHAHLP